MSSPFIELPADNSLLVFEPVDLYFREHIVTNVFARKNNKTLAETLAHRRYAQLAQHVYEKYPEWLEYKLGEFLYALKLAGDAFYLKYLNRYGDGTYCEFEIRDLAYLTKRGVYLYTVNGQIKYIGRCKDNFGKRINYGYGIIHPKNCYLDGQATNCHLNALIAANQAAVAFYVCPIQDTVAIERLESLLIQHYKPEWNIALKKDDTSKRKGRVRTEADHQAFLASLRGWKDEDVEQFLKDNEESRSLNIRPLVEL